MKQARFSLIMSGERELKHNTLLHIATIFQMNVVDIITFPEKYCPIKGSKGSTDDVLQIRLDDKIKDEFLSSFLGSEIKNILK